jgi:dethiobiotin synthetase
LSAVTHIIPHRIAIAGIGTDVGKTLVSALLCAALRCDYWKPVQCGLLPETDTQYVQRLSGLPAHHFHPEAYRLETPASPHHAAAIAGVNITADRLQLPATDNRLLIELAGGLMVPLSASLMNIDLLARWQVPVVLVVRSYLGSINHSLLSLEAMRSRGIPLAGIVLNAGGTPSSEEPILAAAQAPLLGRLPHLETIDAAALQATFEQHFSWGR